MLMLTETEQVKLYKPSRELSAATHMMTTRVAHGKVISHGSPQKQSNAEVELNECTRDGYNKWQQR